MARPDEQSASATKLIALAKHLAKATEDGYVRIAIPGDEMPEGFAVLQKDRFYMALCYDGTRSGVLTKPEQGVRWSVTRAADMSGTLAGVGDLWDLRGRPVVVFGNNIAPDGTIWVMDWETGKREDPLAVDLMQRADRFSLSDENLIARVTSWARKGNADAIWWLAWWFEGTNHPRSMWYYIAALRAAPTEHGWAWERICEDALTPCLQEGVPQPDLSFVADIPEFNGEPLSTDWQAAVAAAEAAAHVPSADQTPVYPRLFHKPPRQSAPDARAV